MQIQPTFREWQLNHAARTDPARFTRLQYRWAMRDINTVTTTIRGFSKIMTEVANQIIQNLEPLVKFAKALNQR